MPTFLAFKLERNYLFLIANNQCEGEYDNYSGNYKQEKGHTLDAHRVY